MLVLGEKFSTYIDTYNHQKFIIKSIDKCNNRKAVLCYRELLGYQLGRIIGLNLPPTFLAIHPLYGRRHGGSH